MYVFKHILYVNYIQDLIKNMNYGLETNIWELQQKKI